MESHCEEQDLFEYVKRSLDEEEDFHFMRFEFLQRLNIVRMELDLVRLKERIKSRGKASTEDLHILKSSLEDYSEPTLEEVIVLDADKSPANTIRNYQYLRSRKEMNKNEANERRWLKQRFFQFYIHNNQFFHSHYCYFDEADTKIDPLRRGLMLYLPSRLAYSGEEYHTREKEYNEGKPPKMISTFVDRLARFLVAFTGSVFLIVPMIIMTLEPSQSKSLIVVSVTVFLFTLLLSFAVRVSNLETLVAAATYAAVMVVFVGATNGNNNGVS